MGERIEAASASFEAAAKKVTDEARASSLDSATKIAANFPARQDHNERDLVALRKRVRDGERAQAELNQAVEKLEEVASTVLAAHPSIDLASLGNWDRQPHFGTFWAGTPEPRGGGSAGSLGWHRALAY